MVRHRQLCWRFFSILSGSQLLHELALLVPLLPGELSLLPILGLALQPQFLVVLLLHLSLLFQLKSMTSC